MPGFELFALVGIPLLALIYPQQLQAGLRFVRGWCWCVAKHRTLAMLGVITLSAGGSAAVSQWVERPLPTVHDEFSYLLAADHFAAVRVSSPTHPHWRAFETFHVIQQPTYASKYPPGQGAALALGIVLARDPLVGVWISSGLLAAALLWMLRAWLPGNWALIGTVLAVGQFGIASYWNQSFWGGAVCALGGALVFGALRRLQCGSRTEGDFVARLVLGIVLGLGLIIMANTRPIEGAVAAVPVMICLFGEAAPFACHRRKLKRLAPALAAIAVVGFCGLVAMLKYNEAITGHPLTLPYTVHEAAYATVPPFLWMRPSTAPDYRHAVMQEFWMGGYTAQSYLENRTASGFAKSALDRLRRSLRFYLGMPMMLAIAALPWVFRQRRFRVCLFASGLVVAMSLATNWYSPHYLAPVAGCIVLIATASLRRLSQLHWRGRPLGAAIACGVLLVAPISTALSIQSRVGSTTGFALARAALQGQLEADEGRHLVFVRYGPRHSAHEEFVYNEADIDHAKVVWARSMSPAEDRSLMDYFADRRAWRLDTGFDPARPLRLQPMVRAGGIGDREARPSEEVRK